MLIARIEREWLEVDGMPAEEGEKRIKGPCPDCAGERNAMIVAEHRQHIDDGTEDSPWCGSICHRILQCRGCDTVYVQRELWFSVDPDETSVVYWPSPTVRSEPKWLPQLADDQLRTLMSDVYTAVNNDLRSLAAIGIRTAFDLSSELLGVDSSLSFAKKLTELEASGKIGKDEREILNTLIDAGSAAAHRGWNPTLDQLNTMLNTIENYLYRSFILGHEATRLKSGVPPRP